LILKDVGGLTVEAIRIAIDDLDVLAISLSASEFPEIGFRCAFEERGAVPVHPVQADEEISRKGDRCLHSHMLIGKISILPILRRHGFVVRREGQEHTPWEGAGTAAGTMRP
jgi:hypothetical protein